LFAVNTAERPLRRQGWTSFIRCDNHFNPFAKKWSPAGLASAGVTTKEQNGNEIYTKCVFDDNAPGVPGWRSTP
jgi:hypothetical protein